MSAAAHPPDAGQIETQRLRHAPFPGRAAGLRVYIEEATHHSIIAHAREDPSIEICGVLVGTWLRDDAGPYVLINASIRGESAKSRFAEVTFTHETWAAINATMDRDFSDRAIVGWYHTHPDFGVFLSDRDTFIHQHFFSAPGQIALVVDPVRREEGVFFWSAGKPTLAPVHWVGGRQVSAAAAAKPTPAPIAVRSGATEHSPSPGSLVNNPVVVGLAVLGVFALGYAAAAWSRAQDRRLLTQGVAAQLYSAVSSPDAFVALQNAQRHIAEIDKSVETLAKPPVNGASGDSLEVASEIRAGAARVRASIAEAAAALRISPEQQEAIELLVVQRIRELIAQGSLMVPSADAAKQPAQASPAPSTPSGPSGASEPAPQAGQPQEKH